MSNKDKYKEALERAKKELDACGSQDCDAARQIFRLFPELKESEDERIRKFLHHTFTAQYLAKDKLGKWHGEPVTNILTWLEKQGEQKPNDEVEPKFKVGDWLQYRNAKPFFVEEIEKKAKEIAESFRTVRCFSKHPSDIAYSAAIEMANWADQHPREGLWDAEKVCKWISERIGIDQKIETNSDGVPLADSYIAYCIARQNAADTIIKDLRKAMED